MKSKSTELRRRESKDMIQWSQKKSGLPQKTRTVTEKTRTFTTKIRTDTKKSGLFYIKNFI